jgi:polar amino acid transport system substrate-binding protein
MNLKIYVLLIVLFGAPLPAYTSEITFLTHEIKGATYIDQHGELRGRKSFGRRAFYLELVREMRINKGHINRHYEVVPFRRGLLYVLENEKPYALFNTGRQIRREGKMKWVGPLSNDTIHAYELKSALTGANTLDEAKEFRICVGGGGNQEYFVTQNGFKLITRNGSNSGCFKMLALNRVDYAVASKYGLMGNLKNASISPDLIQVAPFPLYEVQGYISFTNNVVNSEIQEWQSILDQIKTSGRYAELISEYLVLTP